MFYKIKVNNDIVEVSHFTNGSGFYIVKTNKNSDLVYFNENTEAFFFIEPTMYVPKKILDLFEQSEVEEKPISENTVSEDFALKMLSIAMNKEKFKDVQV